MRYLLYGEGYTIRGVQRILKEQGPRFVIGAGRGGAALAPMIAGFLFTAGYGLQTVSALMALGSVGAFIVLIALPPRRVIAPAAKGAAL
ncbi:MAG: hypothetical protein ACREDG_08585 [Methylocella sp.]